MIVEERINRILLIEEMRKHRETAIRLGLKDKSIIRIKKDKEINRHYSMK